MKAQQEYLIDDYDDWEDIIDSRNIMAHNYNEEDSIDIANKISLIYYKRVSNIYKIVTH